MLDVTPELALLQSLQSLLSIFLNLGIGLLIAGVGQKWKMAFG